MKKQKAKYFTDFGRVIRIMVAETGEYEGPGCRYCVWAYDRNKGKDQVIDTGVDLKKLQEKHGKVPVYKIG